MDIESIKLKITEIYDIYKNDEEVLNRLSLYINHDLPNFLNNYKSNLL